MPAEESWDLLHGRPCKSFRRPALLENSGDDELER